MSEGLKQASRRMWRRVGGSRGRRTVCLRRRKRSSVWWAGWVALAGGAVSWTGVCCSRDGRSNLRISQSR